MAQQTQVKVQKRVGFVEEPIIIEYATPEAEQDRDECIICLQTMEPQDRIFQQPLCGHRLHDACWTKWVLLFGGTQLRCHSCQRPAAQRTLDEIYKSARPGPGSEEKHRAWEELYPICRSALLADLELQGTHWEEGPLKALMFNFLIYEFATFVHETERDAENFRVLVEQWFKEVRDAENFRVLAALLWEEKPHLFAEMAPLARFLGPAREAHYILAELYAAAPWRDLDKCLIHIAAAFAAGHQQALGLLGGLSETLEKERVSALAAARAWEKAPGEIAKMPSLAQLLGLDHGTAREAHYILAEYYATAPTRDVHKCLVYSAAASAEGHQQASDMLVSLREELEEEDISVSAATVASAPSALLWEKMPSLLAPLLGLDQGTVREAYYILAERYASAPWKDPDKYLFHCKVAAALGHPRALAILLPKLTQRLRELFWDGAFDACREHLHGLQSDEEGPLAPVASFLSELVDRVEAAPDSFMWWKQLEWLRHLLEDGRKQEQLALLMRGGAPVEEMDSNDHLILAELYSSEAFRDLKKVRFHCEQALTLTSSQAKQRVLVPVVLQITQQVRSEVSLCMWLLETVLALDESNREVQRELRRLRARSALDGF